MRTTTRSSQGQPVPPPPAQPRQRTIAFDVTAIQDMDADRRGAVILALAVILRQAAGVRLPEDDDVGH